MIIQTNIVLMKILLTCFNPFGGGDVNVSKVVAKHFASLLHEGYDFVVEQLPVSFEHVSKTLSSLIELHEPNVVMMLGQASSREKISIERVAINMMDSKMGDNNGFAPCEQTIIPLGENALFSNMPLKRIVENWREAGIDGVISNSAGLYVCNCSFYHALSISQRLGNDCKVGFIHLPKLTEDKVTMKYAIDQMTTAVDIAIRTVIE